MYNEIVTTLRRQAKPQLGSEPEPEQPSSSHLSMESVPEAVVCMASYLKHNPKRKRLLNFIKYFYGDNQKRDRVADMGQDKKATVFFEEYEEIFQLTKLPHGQTAGICF